MTEQDPPALRRLDDRVVPALQRGARAVARGLAAPLVGAHRLEQRLFGGRPYRFGWRRRATVRMVVVVIGLAGSAVHLQRYPDIVEARERERAAALQQTITRPDLGLDVELPTNAVVLGPPLGGDPQAYVDERTSVLSSLPAGDRVAVVSLDAYVGVDDVLAILPDGVRILRAQYRMPDVREAPLETEVVGSDLAASIDRIIADEVALLDEEEAAQQELLDSGTIESEEFERDARERIAEIQTIRSVLRATGGIVFAVVVEADSGVLRDLSRRAAVRLVDVLPADADPATSVVFGLKPDDRAEVTFGVPS